MEGRVSGQSIVLISAAELRAHRFPLPTHATFAASGNPQAAPHLDLLQAAAVGCPLHLEHIQLATLEVLRLGVGQLVGACGRHAGDWGSLRRAGKPAAARLQGIQARRALSGPAGRLLSLHPHSTPPLQQTPTDGACIAQDGEVDRACRACLAHVRSADLDAVGAQRLLLQG